MNTPYQETKNGNNKSKVRSSTGRHPSSVFRKATADIVFERHDYVNFIFTTYLCMDKDTFIKSTPKKLLRNQGVMNQLSRKDALHIAYMAGVECEISARDKNHVQRMLFEQANPPAIPTSQEVKQEIALLRKTFSKNKKLTPQEIITAHKLFNSRKISNKTNGGVS